MAGEASGVRQHTRFKPILVAFDGSQQAGRAAHVGLDLGADINTPVTFLLFAYAVAPAVKGGDVADITLQAKNIALAHGLRDEAIEIMVETGHLAKTTVIFASRHGYDVIVMGRRGIGPVKSLLLGSVSAEVLSLAECTVVTAK